MARFRRYLPFIGAVLIFGLIELVIANPAIWLWGIVGIFAAVLVTSAVMTNVDRLPRGWWHTVFSPLLLGVSALLLTLFVNTSVSRNLIALVTTAFHLFFWENLWRYYWAPERYHDEALENTSLGLNTTTIWFTSLLFYYILLDPSVLPPNFANNILALTTLAILLTVFFMDFGTVWVRRYPPGKVWLWLIAVSLVVGEIFWVTNFLPHRVEVKSFLVVLTYYLLTHLGRSHLDGTLRRSQVRRYLGLAFACLALVLITARWLP